MKKMALGMVIGLLLMGIVTEASASLAQFAGTWVNINPNTGGITKVVITIAGTNVKVHAWGKCHPTDCDWKTVQGFAYGPNAGANLPATAMAISAIYKESFAETLLIIRPLAQNQLRVESYTRFTDTSGRTNYAAVETFKRP